MQGILAEGVTENSWAAAQERRIQNVNDIAPLDTSEGAWGGGGGLILGVGYWTKGSKRCD